MRNLRQKATYWQSEIEDGLGGYVAYSDPILINVRWEDISELIRDKEGHEVISNAIVYVDRELPDEEGFLALGDYTHLNENPKLIGQRIIKVETTPSLRNDKKIIKVIL